MSLTITKEQNKLILQYPFLSPTKIFRDAIGELLATDMEPPKKYFKPKMGERKDINTTTIKISIIAEHKHFIEQLKTMGFNASMFLRDKINEKLEEGP